jgi:hypothetical protein
VSLPCEWSWAIGLYAAIVVAWAHVNAGLAEQFLKMETVPVRGSLQPVLRVSINFICKTNRKISCL